MVLVWVLVVWVLAVDAEPAVLVTVVVVYVASVCNRTAKKERTNYE